MKRKSKTERFFIRLLIISAIILFLCWLTGVFFGNYDFLGWHPKNIFITYEVVYIITLTSLLALISAIIALVYIKVIAFGKNRNNSN